jgi:hypothetical protein
MVKMLKALLVGERYLPETGEDLHSYYVASIVTETKPEKIKQLIVRESSRLSRDTCHLLGTKLMELTELSNIIFTEVDEKNKVVKLTTRSKISFVFYWWKIKKIFITSSAAAVPDPRLVLRDTVVPTGEQPTSVPAAMIGDLVHPTSSKVSPPPLETNLLPPPANFSDVDVIPQPPNFLPPRIELNKPGAAIADPRLGVVTGLEDTIQPTREQPTSVPAVMVGDLVRQTVSALTSAVKLSTPPTTYPELLALQHSWHCSTVFSWRNSPLGQVSAKLSTAVGHLADTSAVHVRAHIDHTN